MEKCSNRQSGRRDHRNLHFIHDYLLARHLKYLSWHYSRINTSVARGRTTSSTKVMQVSCQARSASKMSYQTIVSWVGIHRTTQCVRLVLKPKRITSRGELVPCVHDRLSTSLANAWDGHRLQITLADRLLVDAIAAKPEIGPRNQLITMAALGGYRGGLPVVDTMRGLIQVQPCSAVAATSRARSSVGRTAWRGKKMLSVLSKGFLEYFLTAFLISDFGDLSIPFTGQERWPAASSSTPSAKPCARKRSSDCGSDILPPTITGSLSRTAGPVPLASPPIL